jgi:hypothetical protein
LHAVKAQHVAGQTEPAELIPFDLESFLEHFVRFSAAGIRACAEEENTRPESLRYGEK